MDDTDDVVEEFRAWLERRGKSALTVLQYCACMKTLFREGHDVLDEASLNAFLHKHTVERRSHYFVSAVRAFLDFFLIDDRAAFRKLAKRLRPPQSVEPYRVRAQLSDEQVDRVLSFLASHRHRLIALLQRDLGLRAGDVLWLRREDVEFDQQDARIPLRIIVTAKGGRRRALWVYDEGTRERLAQYIENVMFDETYIFLNSSLGRSVADRHMRTYALYRVDLMNALFSAGLDPRSWSTHDFRRRLARRVWDKYADVSILQGMLGHVKVETTLRYLRHSGLGTRDVLRELWREEHSLTTKPEKS